MKNSYSIRKSVKLGIEVYILTVTDGDKVLHESSHMSQAGAVSRLLQYRNTGK